ncbi:MAG: hypothetical protein H7061_11990 [Bdellovibrionaceae bacterium]|nr:hypothetical protein [Bdellovibrio sp.]
MKIAIAIIIISIFTAYATKQGPLWRGTYLNEKAVKAKWGQAPLDYSKFKLGDLAIRSKMAASILRDQTLIGKSADSIRQVLGDPDGFFYIDAYPAYLIQEGHSKSEETWQLVFLLDSKFKVKEIKVHKNCCD